MDTKLLENIGLTQGEIRVYEAVITLGKSSTGPIMKKAEISSSKVYLILEKLVKKGFVTYTTENNVKKFLPTNPENILEYIQHKQSNLEIVKKKAVKLTKELKKLMNTHTEESVKIYEGTKSMLNAFQNILDELHQKTPFLFFGAPITELENLEMFFGNLQAKREKKKLFTKGIIHPKTEKKYKEIFEKRKRIQIKTSKIVPPHAIGIGTKRIIISLWNSPPIGFEIQSDRLAKRYREHFMEVWESG